MRQPDGNGIADLFRDFDFRPNENEIVREHLNSGRFSMRDGAMSVRMEVAPLFRFEELCADGDGRPVPP